MPRKPRRSTSTPRAKVARFLAVLWLALFALAQPVAAQTFPKLTGRVVDQANLLSPEQELDVSSKSAALEAQTGRQFVVATVNSLEGRPIEDYGYRLGRSWGIGQKGKDNGVILLVAPNERKVRVETGYGARVFLTDAVSSVIIRNSILPHFRQNPPDYAGGITEGAAQIIKQMSLPSDQAQRNVQQAERAQQQREDASPGILPVLFWILIISFVILSFARRAGGRRHGRRRRGWGGPIILWGPGWGGGGSSWGGGGGSSWGGGGGFGGFSGGGGSFGGGGASGSW